MPGLPGDIKPQFPHPCNGFLDTGEPGQQGFGLTVWPSLVKRSLLAKSLTLASCYPAKKAASCSESLGGKQQRGPLYNLGETAWILREELIFSHHPRGVKTSSSGNLREVEIRAGGQWWGSRIGTAGQAGDNRHSYSRRRTATSVPCRRCAWTPAGHFQWSWALRWGGRGWEGGACPLTPSPFLPPLLESGARREQGVLTHRPGRRLPWTLWEGMGSQQTGWHRAGPSNSWPAGLPVETQVGPASLPMINVVMCGWPPSTRTGKAPKSSRNTLLTKTSLARLVASRSLPGAQAPLADSLELLGGPSYLRKTPKINFRDTSPYRKVGGSREA